MQKCGLRGPFGDEAFTRREATARLVRVPRLLCWRCVVNFRSGVAIQGNAINANWPFDVLQGLLSQILESEVQAVADVVAH